MVILDRNPTRRTAMHPLRNLTTNIAGRLRGNARPLALAALGAAALAAPAMAPAPAEADVKVIPQEVRHLHGLFAHEDVPAYKCPDSYPYLEDRNYAPFGTSLVNGVSVNQAKYPWPIGISITGATWTPWEEWEIGWYRFATGTRTGFHSSATAWEGGDNWYRVSLHCTDDKQEAARSYKL
jgi:hypothetical protein